MRRDRFSSDESNQNFYSFSGERIYIQSGDTKATLSPGLYSIKYCRNSGDLYMRQQAKSTSDDMLSTPTLDEILNIVSTFYNGVKTNTFANAGYKSKFGVLLEGPPGTGKSQTMTTVMTEFIALGGIVVNVSDYEVLDDHNLGKYLRKINNIQKDQPLMIVFEDVDRVEDYQEVFLTSILDGEQSPENTIFFATTNFKEEISDRLKRPGRFDFIYTIDKITDEVRIVYIQKKIQDLKLEISQETFDEIVSVTKGYNFSEIRTFVAYFGFFGFKPADIASKLEDRISDVDARAEFRFSKREYLIAKNQEARDEYDIDD